jgi:hypothetical protein
MLGVNAEALGPADITDAIGLALTHALVKHSSLAAPLSQPARPVPLSSETKGQAFCLTPAGGRGGRCGRRDRFPSGACGRPKAATVRRHLVSRGSEGRTH